MRVRVAAFALTPRTLREVRRQILIYAGLAPFVVIAMFPIYWMAITAFKQDADLYRLDVAPLWFHLPPTLEHFTRLFTQTYFAAQLLNTLQLAACVVGLTILLAVPAGYSLARLRLPGAETLGIAIFLTYLVPSIILFIPLARVVGMLGLFDSWWALVVVYPGFTIPFCTWKMLGYFKTVPLEVEEAAWLDGCSRIGGLCRIVLPVSRPGIAISAIFAFSLSMQEYLYAVAYVAPRSEKVVTVGLATALIRGDIFFWGSLMAGALVVGLPIALLYSLVLDRFIEGLTGVGSSL
jgi:multiple sugar transport system permease protein